MTATAPITTHEPWVIPPLGTATEPPAGSERLIRALEAHSAAEAQGKVFVTTELGGGGTATARTIAIARRGVRNVLMHAGILEGTLDGNRAELRRGER